MTMESLWKSLYIVALYVISSIIFPFLNFIFTAGYSYFVFWNQNLSGFH